jgi:chromosome segregation ATPase
MTHPIVRRAATSAGVLLVLFLGIASIRAAAAWTAAAADLEQPITTSSLEDQLAVERARSAALATQLHDLVTRSAELEDALAAAEGRITDDADVAAALATQLATARDRLATLEESIRAANARLASSSKSGGTTSAAAPARASHEDEEHHEEHEEESGD